MSTELDRIIGDLQPMGENLRLGGSAGLFAYPAAGPGEASADSAADLAAFGDLPY
ncbi:hypothetical protein ACQEVM_37250 [Streptomyces sp. CA-243310]|uniref:hypothetical protein n=1 Tax=Streptomyces sp. CA-243310 TaxID=3240056 RepID=UPI003D8B821B